MYFTVRFQGPTCAVDSTDEVLYGTSYDYMEIVVDATRAGGEANIDLFFFARSYNGSCGNHPSLAEQRLIAEELTAYLKAARRW